MNPTERLVWHEMPLHVGVSTRWCLGALVPWYAGGKNRLWIVGRNDSHYLSTYLPWYICATRSCPSSRQSTPSNLALFLHIYRTRGITIIDPYRYPNRTCFILRRSYGQFFTIYARSRITHRLRICQCTREILFPISIQSSTMQRLANIVHCQDMHPFTSAYIYTRLRARSWGHNAEFRCPEAAMQIFICSLGSHLGDNHCL